MRRALLYWAPLVAWMLVIFLASSRPHVPYQDDVPDWIPHMLVFLALAVLAARAFNPGAVLGPRVAAAAFVFCIAYGISDEWHQSYVPGRQADPWDVLKDAVGALGGVAAYHAWSRRTMPAQARQS